MIENHWNLDHETRSNVFQADMGNLWLTDAKTFNEQQLFRRAFTPKPTVKEFARFLMIGP